MTGGGNTCGCGCGQAPTSSLYFATESCQRKWHARHRADTRGATDAGNGPAGARLWRPTLYLPQQRAIVDAYALTLRAAGPAVELFLRAVGRAVIRHGGDIHWHLMRAMRAPK